MSDPFFERVLKLMEEAGWSIAQPANLDEKTIGMVIGTREYVDSVVKHLPEKYITINPPKAKRD